MPHPPKTRQQAAGTTNLLPNLEKRLNLLTRVLNEAEIAEKSMDIVKEIKELCAILRACQETDPARQEVARQIVVVWGEDALPTHGATHGTAQGTARSSAQSTNMTGTAESADMAATADADSGGPQA